MRALRALELMGLVGLIPGMASAQHKHNHDRRPDASEAPAAPSLEARRAVFADVDAAYAQGDKATAADKLFEIVDDPSKADFHAEAWARLGGTLAALDLPYAALLTDSKALITDAHAVSSIASQTIALGEKVGDTALLESAFARNMDLDVDAATRSRMAYLAAREAHRQGHYGTALEILEMVRSDDPYYPEAMALKGVVLSLQGRYDDALAPLLIAGAAGRKAGRGQDFADVVNLDIARAYYAAQNYPRAIQYFARVSRQSPQWPEAQFERAWAHFRLQDMNGVLSLLQTLDSPFFRDWYFPEASLLRIYALFMMCKFPEASDQVDAFKARYAPQQQALAQVAEMSPEAAFREMQRYLDGGETGLPREIVRRFSRDRRFLAGVNAVRNAEDELARLRHVSSHPFTQRAAAAVTARRDAIVREAGARIVARARQMADELAGMLSNADLSKLDMMQLETRLYQLASAKGAPPQARRRVQRRIQVRPGYHYWPFEGEYWIDEVGWYRVHATPDCPVGLKVGGDEK